MSERFLAVNDVARVLGVSPSAVKLWERQGRLPAPMGRLGTRGDRIWRQSDIEGVRGLPDSRPRTQVRKEPVAA